MNVPMSETPSSPAPIEGAFADFAGTLLTGLAPAATPAAVVADSAPAAEAPIAYDFKFPEGLEVEASRLESFKDFCQSQKLSQEAAQALIDWQSKDLAADLAAETQQQAEISQAWADSLRNDAEIGGKNYAATEASCHRVASRFFTAELKTLLNDSGLGNHPEFVRVFARIGATLGEDRSLAPSAPAAAPRSFNMFPKSLG